MIKLDAHNILVPFSQGGRAFTAYIAQPSFAELNKISRTLGYIFSKFKQKEFDELVIATDWEFIVEDYLAQLPRGAEYFDELKAFLDRRISPADIFDSETGETIDKLEAEGENVLKGTLLFFSSLFRYAPQIIQMKKTKGFFTSLSGLEYQDFLKKSHAERKAKATPQH